MTQAQPTANWTMVPVKGTYLTEEGAPESGTVILTLAGGGVDTVADVIVRDDVTDTVTLDSSGGIPTGYTFPATDAVDIRYGSVKPMLSVVEKLSSGKGKTYAVALSIGLLPAGLDLATVRNTGIAANSSPAALAVGVPGGVARVNADGAVVDSAGDVLPTKDYVDSGLSNRVSTSGGKIPASMIPDLSGTYASATDLSSGLAGKASVVGGKIASGVIPDLSGTYATTAQGTLAANAVPRGSIILDARDYGVVVDGSTDDASAFAAAITAATAATAFGTPVVEIPFGNMLVKSTTNITTNGVIIRGKGYYRSRIMADGCDAVTVAAGVSDFQMFDVELVAKTLYSTTVNTQTGVRIEGTASAHPQGFIFQNVFVNGFKTGFYCRYLWSSNFLNCRTGSGLVGLAAYGLSVNNRVIGGQLNVTGAGATSGSRCVALLGYESDTDSTPVASEGWTITGGTLMDGGEIGVEITANAHVVVSDNIIDHCGLHGVLIQGNGTNFGGNSDIHDNYIAMNTTSGVAGIRNANTVANAALKRTRVHHNILAVYSGATCTYGINQSGANGLMIVDGNSCMGFTTADIYVASAGNILGPNDLKSSSANNVSAVSGGCLTNVQGANGKVMIPAAGMGSPFAYTMNGNVKHAYWLSAPTINTWAVGDTIHNWQPTTGSPLGWVCTTAGTPGTWKALANL